MAQWGQGQQGFQYPMQTGYPGGNPQFQQNPQFQPPNPQFQQPNQQFQQQGGLGIPPGGGLLPQQTGFPGQRPQGFQQPQQTGFPGGSGFVQQQPTGFPGGNNFQQQGRPGPPPVPQIPSQFQQPNQPSFLNAPPPQPNRLMSASPGFGGGLIPQQTGFGGRPGGGGMLVPQMTGFIDPRLQMMSQTFMPLNTSAPYNAMGAPQLQPQSQNLMQTIQQHNQAQRGSTNQQMAWALTKAEKKNYDSIFRQWVQGAQFMSGPTAIEVFGASGLPKDDLARIWTLADINDRGKLNLAEFHVAMGLIYRRLNGMQVPDVLPPELVPPSHRDLDDSVDRVKDLLKKESRTHSPSSLDSPISYLKNRSFNGSSPSLESNRDATIYKHTDAEPSGIYKPRSRHVDRDAIRSRNEDDSPSADLSDLKRQLANTASMLDRNAEADAMRTREDEELDREMDDLKYRAKRVQEDLDYTTRGPKTASKEEERRRLEREMLSLLHERIPEVERKIKARDERKEKEKRQWARDRDRANDRFGRHDSRDDYSRRDDRPYSRGDDRPYSRGDDRDRPYSRSDDRDRYSRDDRERPHSRNDERDRPYSRGGHGREDDYRRRSPSRERDRPRSPPALREAPAPPPVAPASSIRNPPPAPTIPQSTPSPSVASMTPEQRKVYLQEQAKLRIQARMAALGVTQTASSTLDTSVEDRLQQEKKEAEEKTKAAEKQAEERERARKERLDNEKALKEGRNTPAAPPAPTPTSTAPPPAPTPRTAPAPAPTPKVAPPPPKPRAPAPPPPRKAQAPRSAFSAAVSAPPPIVPAPPPVPEVDPEEERLRAREEAMQKARVERERKLRELEEQEAAAKLEEERYQARLQALKNKSVRSPSPPPVQAVPPPTPPAPPEPRSAPALSSPAGAEKSTNPFSRLLKEGGGGTPPAIPPTSNGGSTNPWARPQTAPLPSVPQPSKSPAPNSAKTAYQTAPASIDDDWDDIKEKDGDDDSSDDEIAQSRSARAGLATRIFGNILPRPTSAAASVPVSSPSSPAASGASPPAPPPPPPVQPPIVAPVAAAPAASDVGALMRSIQGGMKLRKATTVDKSAPPVSGKVLGDSAPPAHINAVARAPSPPARAPSPPPPAPVVHIDTSATPSMVHDDASRSSNRQSVGWFADRAADVGGSPVMVERLGSTAEEDEDDMYETPSPIPEILVHESASEPTSDLMADIDKTVEHRARSLYAFEGEGPDDLSFGENLVIIANPSKSDGDWWYGKTVSTGKKGLFPKTYVEVVHPKKAKAVYTYTGNNPDELPFTEGDILSIIDTSEEEWWKTEQGGVVFIVPAAYLELVEEVVDDRKPHVDVSANADANPMTSHSTANVRILTAENLATSTGTDEGRVDSNAAAAEDTSDDDSDSDYLSFDESDNDDATHSKEARERERQLVLEAAGLIVQQNVGPPPLRPKSRSIKRRPAPAAPKRTSIYKDLPPVPTSPGLEPDEEHGPIAEPEPEPEPELSHEARLDDAFARYESFKNTQSNLNRLSVVSTDSSISQASPTATISSMSIGHSSSHSHGGKTDGEGRAYSHFLNFLSRSKTPDAEHRERRSAATLNISAPIMASSTSAGTTSSHKLDSPSRSNSPSFGMSWASLVDKTALEGIPPGERKRQEVIFELINTEIAYVRDLQLIVEVFYSSMLALLSTKEITVVFANIEDLLLINTSFVSSLEERQKDCRLYIDKIGDILLAHLPSMGAYMEYCVNQSTAIKVLQSLRESKPVLSSHLQTLRDANPSVRNLDLSSYLLAPMQRITRYPLLIKQILQYTEVGEEHGSIQAARDMSERLLDHINETIREQEGHETLKKISQNLWIGQGRLDLSAPTRHMGTRRLLKEGVLIKAKSGRKLNAFLCSDILVLTDESVKNLYRMPIPLAHAKVKDSGSRDDTTFNISQPYPRGGEAVSLRALSARDCQQWIQEIAHASKKARHAEERTARKSGRR